MCRVERLSGTVLRGILPDGVPEFLSPSVHGHVADIFYGRVQEMKLSLSFPQAHRCWAEDYRFEQELRSYFSWWKFAALHTCTV